MKNWQSYVLPLAAGVLLVAAHAVAQTQTVSPTTPAQGTRPVAPPQQPARAGAGGGNVEHGRYLVERVAMCVECHSPRDESGNIIDSERYLGAPIPVRPSWGSNWAIRAPRNKGLPGYTDELAMRLLTQGSISRDGAPLRPPMPRFYMNPQDAADVIAFMRSLP